MSGCSAVRLPLADAKIEDNRFSLFKEKFFEAWGFESEESAGSKLDAMCEDIKNRGDLYGENLMPVSFAKIKKILDIAGSAKESKVFKNAITVRNSDMRVLPTDKPLFKNPSIAGEGYPFDYLQNSRIYISTPLKLLYATPQRDYYFAKTPVGYGWIDARNVAFTDSSFEELFRSLPLMGVVNDKKALYAESGVFVERLNIGTLLPQGVYPARDELGYAVWKRYAPSDNLQKLPFVMNDTAVALIGYSLYGEPYGWGGYLDNRDCSMFLRDMFFNFGIYLPRNSAEQAAGYVDIEKLNNAAKKAYIKANAKPWRTLIYLKGHIMLYVGEDLAGEPLVLHDAWGIKSFKDGKEGREMLGGIVVTTMEEGKGRAWYDEAKSSILSKVLGIKQIY